MVEERNKKLYSYKALYKYTNVRVCCLLYYWLAISYKTAKLNREERTLQGDHGKELDSRMCEELKSRDDNAISY